MLLHILKPYDVWYNADRSEDKFPFSSVFYISIHVVVQLNKMMTKFSIIFQFQFAVATGCLAGEGFCFSVSITMTLTCCRGLSLGSFKVYF